MSDRVEVLIDRPAFFGEVGAVQDAFTGISADVTVESGYETRGLGDYPWVVIITLSGWTVAVFVKKVTELAAEDAYTALKRWVRSVAAARRRFRSTGGNIRVEDGRISIVLREDLPDEAFAALIDMDLDALPDGAYIVWDSDAGEWRLRP